MVVKTYIFLIYFLGYGALITFTWCFIRFNSLKEFIFWLFWDLSGLRFVYEKIWPTSFYERSERRPPATFTIWVLGIYAAVYGISQQRYENARNILEIKTNGIFSQLSTPAWKLSFSRIPKLQNERYPEKPEFLKPISVFRSLFGEGDIDLDNVELLISVIEGRKDSLTGIDLTNINLEGANLINANLEDTILVNAKFNRANLTRANFKNSVVIDASFANATLDKVNFENSCIGGANFLDASCIETNLKNVHLVPVMDKRFEETFSTGAAKVRFNFLQRFGQSHSDKEVSDLLCKAKCLFGSDMSESLASLMIVKCPQKMKDPFPPKPINFNILNN